MTPEEETKVCPSCGFERCLHVSRCKCEHDKQTGLVHLESAERETEKLQALVAEMTKERRVAVKQHMDDLLEAKSTCPYSGLTCVIDDDDEEGVDPATAN